MCAQTTTPPRDERPIAEIRFRHLERVNPDAAGAELDTQVRQAARRGSARSRHATAVRHRRLRARRLPRSSRRRAAACSTSTPSRSRGVRTTCASVSGSRAICRARTRSTRRSSYRRTWINALGGEWRTDLQIGQTSRFYSELYQPLDDKPVAVPRAASGIRAAYRRRVPGVATYRTLRRPAVDAGARCRQQRDEIRRGAGGYSGRRRRRDARHRSRGARAAEHEASCRRISVSGDPGPARQCELSALRLCVVGQRQAVEQVTGRDRRIPAMGCRLSRCALVRPAYVPRCSQGGRQARRRYAAGVRSLPVGRLPAAVGLSDRIAAGRTPFVRTRGLFVQAAEPAAARRALRRRVAGSRSRRLTAGAGKRPGFAEVGRGVTSARTRRSGRSISAIGVAADGSHSAYLFLGRP